MKYKFPISVIMPCYNSERYIEQAIGSILRQTFADLELIIINDGSTDNTENIIRGFSDERIKYIRRLQNCGNYTARNIGLSEARGKYLCVMDSDDIALDDRLEAQYKCMEDDSSLGCLGGLGKIIDENNYPIKNYIKLPIEDEHLRIYLLENNYFIHSTIMIRSSVLQREKLAYNKNIRCSGDYDFIVKLSQKSRVKNLEKDLVMYRIHPQQLSSIETPAQIAAADIVRLSQLSAFNIHINFRERDLHLKLMKNKYLAEYELDKCESWFNKLLDANAKKKVYDESILYHFLENILCRSIIKNRRETFTISTELVQFLERKLQKNSALLEFGSGEGTDTLLKNFRITSVEHNSYYAIKRANHHICVFASLRNNWYDRSKVKTIIKNKYDMILIDGPPGELRKGILNNLDLFKNIKVPVVFDDVHRQLDMEVMLKFCAKLGYSNQIIKGNSKWFAFCEKSY